MSQDQQQLSVEQSRGELEPSCESVEDEAGRLVPVTEAIKYRKRAQAAEKQVAELNEQLTDQQQQRDDLQERLKHASQEMELTQQLVKAGAIDVEVATLLAKKQLKGRGQELQDSRELVESLRRERPYLFGDGPNESAGGLAGPTAGVRSRKSAGTSNLSRMAQRAAQSGSAKDMQEYLRVRRSVRR